MALMLFCHSQDWNKLDPNPLVAANVGDTFAKIPGGCAEEMRALTECIRSTLQENVVSISTSNRTKNYHKCLRHSMQKKKWWGKMNF